MLAREQEARTPHEIDGQPVEDARRAHKGGACTRAARRNRNWGRGRARKVRDEAAARKGRAEAAARTHASLAAGRRRLLSAEAHSRVGAAARKVWFYAAWAWDGGGQEGGAGGLSRARLHATHSGLAQHLLAHEEHHRRDAQPGSRRPGAGATAAAGAAWQAGIAMPLRTTAYNGDSRGRASQ